MDKAREKSTPVVVKIIACRVCLRTTGKMCCIASCGLKQSFFDITGIQVLQGDGLPQHICYMCHGILQKAVQFRNKCHSTRSLLSSHPLTLNLMKNISLLHGQPLTRTNIVYIDVDDVINDEQMESNLNDKQLESTLNEKKVENMLNDNELVNKLDDIKFSVTETNELIDENDNDAELTTDNDLNDDFNSITDSDNEWYSYDVRDLKAIRRSKLKDEKRHEKTIMNHIFMPKTSYHRMFYKYIDDKYLKKTWQNDELKNKTYPIGEDTATTFSQDYKENTINEFYVYLKNFYGYVDEKRDEAFMKLFNEKKTKAGFVHKGPPTYFQMLSWKRSLEFTKQYNFEVKEMSQEEQIKDFEARKEKEFYKLAKFKCTDCYTGFQYEQTYKRHRMQHDPVLSGKYGCEICKLMFVKKVKLYYHVRRSHKFIYICKECGKQYRNRMHCKEHFKYHNGGAVYKCKYCPTVFRKHWYYYDHMREKHGTVACDICYKRMMPNGMSRHKRIYHVEAFKCQSCEKEFNDAAALDKHLSSFPPNEGCDPDSWPCGKCGETFSAETDLMEHIIASHKKRKRRIFQPKILQSNEAKAKKDKISDKRVKPRSRSIMCERCGYTCTGAAVLRAHGRIHTGEKPYQCPACPKRFRVKELLKYHYRTHTGEKPYKCPLCQKAFTLTSHLYKHQSVHTKLRPFQCSICDKFFAHKTTVKSHIKTVHMKQPSAPVQRKRKRKVVQSVEERVNPGEYEIRVVEKVTGKRHEEEPEKYMEDDIGEDEDVIVEDKVGVNVEDIPVDDILVDDVPVDDTRVYVESETEFLEDWQEFGDEVTIEACDKFD